MLSKFLGFCVFLCMTIITAAQEPIILPKNKKSFCKKVAVKKITVSRLNLTIGCTNPKNITHYHCILDLKDFNIDAIKDKRIKITINKKRFTGKLQFVYNLDFDEYIYEIKLNKSRLKRIGKIYNKFRQEEFPLPEVETNTTYYNSINALIKNHFSQNDYYLQEDQLAQLDQLERNYLKKMIYALKGYVFEDTLWLKHFEFKEWYNKVASNSHIQWTSADSSNLQLLQCFERVLELPTNSSGFSIASLLNGCWQTGGTTVGAGYADLFTFNSANKKYTFQTNNEGSEEKTELAHKGTFSILNMELVLIVHEKENALNFIRRPEPKGLNKVDTIRGKLLPIVLAKERREQRVLRLSSMHFITTPDGLAKVFIKIGDMVYWQIAKAVEDCRL
jgi:hypothetical protein